MGKGVNQNDRANPSSRARRHAGGRHVGRAAVHAVPASGTHAEGSECPAVTALCWRAPVHDVHGRLGSAKWRGHTRRCADRLAPLAAGATARRRALQTTPRVHRSPG
jgi:hypothetical protein